MSYFPSTPANYEVILTDESARLITVDEFQAYNKNAPLGDTDEEMQMRATIDALIVASQEELRRITNRPMLPERWEAKFVGFPYQFIIDATPIQRIISVQYYDTDELLQTINSDNYLAEFHQGKISADCKITPRKNYDWPNSGQISCSREYPVIVTMDVGFGELSL